MQYHVGILLRLPSSKLAQTSFVTMKDLRVISSQKQKISILRARKTRCSVLRYNTAFVSVWTSSTIDNQSAKRRIFVR